MRHSQGLEAAREIAYRYLKGAGDAKLGEWTETMQSFHLRRRLTEEEAAGIVPAVLDIRGTPEAWARFKALPAWCRKVAGGQPL